MGRKCLEAHLVMGPKARQKEEEEVTRPRGACRDAVVGRGRRGEGRKGEISGAALRYNGFESRCLQWNSVFTMSGNAGNGDHAPLLS